MKMFARQVHTCPTPTTYQRGMLWDCDYCGQRWKKLRNKQPVWKRVSS